MPLQAVEYSGQILFAFIKLIKLLFEKGKLHNISLIVELRALLLTLMYNGEPEVDMVTAIFQLGILLKKLRFFTSAHTD